MLQGSNIIIYIDERKDKMSEIKIGLMPVIIEVAKYEYDHFMPEINRRLEEILGKNISGLGRLINTGIVTNIKEARIARAELVKQDVDIIIIVNMTYTPSEVPFTAIRGLHIPLIVLNTSLSKGLKTSDTLKHTSTEHGIVGSTELASILKRIEYPCYYIVSGLMDKDSTYNKITPIIRAVGVKKLLSNSNIGYIGSTVYTGMMDIEADETLLKSKLGLDIIHLRN